ncbi:NifB/NifX family molybdenum-iron cluster-binding protein [Tolumonas lignilytica]|uniref:NifB/NifX family molybdenum-iron cluster-binding protein n=1 Tax=Tolumonas lignilytica TaxID=1283284 RepID=UPI0004663056|nr:NifB/NifX family molybdenum-iron cluster-binding protein [Tolumonas lignilytica]
MLKVAFASSDGVHIDQHFGASEQLMIFEVQPGMADLLNVGHFEQATMKGEHKDKVPGYEDNAEPASVLESEVTQEEQPALLTEDKVIAKIEFVGDCAAVYAASIGTSSIRRLMNAGIQPVIVDYGHELVDLLNEVSFALVHGGLSWVDRAKAKNKAPDRFSSLENKSWSGLSSQHALITDLTE